MTCCQRWNHKHAFSSHMQHGSAGRHDFQLRTRSEEIRYLRGSIQYLLEVVQQQQKLPVSQMYLQLTEQWLVTTLFEIESLADSRHDQGRSNDGSHIHEHHPIGEVTNQRICYLEAQARFPDPTCASHCH